jgi:hypothetical protein
MLTVSSAPTKKTCNTFFMASPPIKLKVLVYYAIGDSFHCCRKKENECKVSAGRESEYVHSERHSRLRGEELCKAAEEKHCR